MRLYSQVNVMLIVSVLVPAVRWVVTEPLAAQVMVQVSPPIVSE